jgi:tetratricopeptide (TPR) repeat protein
LSYFQKAVKLDPTNPNVYDSLGECYKTMGDKKNAIKFLKKSLSMNPPPNVKANSEKLLAELDAM